MDSSVTESTAENNEREILLARPNLEIVARKGRGWMPK